MIERKETLSLDICDYAGNKVCNLYDNQSNSNGQAFDIVVTKERNGWKELSFSLPWNMNTLNGPEKNYRVDMLIADYKIRLKDDDGIDWYLISEPKISHNNFTKTIDVKAGHICQ